MGYVDGSILCPSKTLSVTDGATVPKENPNYPIWISNDAHVRMLIISIILEASFRHVQEYADELATISEPVKDKDLVMLVVSGLRKEYNGLKIQSLPVKVQLHLASFMHSLVIMIICLKKLIHPLHHMVHKPFMVLQCLALAQLSALGFHVSPIAPSGPQAFYGARPNNNNKSKNNNNHGKRNNSRDNNNNRGRGNGRQFDWAST
ncbi:hypothetical protein Tco_0484736 [Tanacetum coccineum]